MSPKEKEDFFNLCYLAMSPFPTVCPYFASLNTKKHNDGYKQNYLKSRHLLWIPRLNFPVYVFLTQGHNRSERSSPSTTIPRTNVSAVEGSIHTFITGPSVLRSHKAGRKSPQGDWLSEKLLSKQISLSYGTSLALSRADIWTDRMVAPVLLAVNRGPFLLHNHILPLGFVGYTH